MIFHTTAEQAKAAGRLERKFWAVYVDNGLYRVVHVSGFSTPNEGYWWVPELGYSMAEGQSLLNDKDEAVTKALHLIDIAMEKLVASRDELEAVRGDGEGRAS